MLKLQINSRQNRIKTHFTYLPSYQHQISYIAQKERREEKTKYNQTSQTIYTLARGQEILSQPSANLFDQKSNQSPTAKKTIK